MKIYFNQSGKTFRSNLSKKHLKMDAALWVEYLLECKYVNLNSNFDNRWSYLNDTKQADIC